MKAVLGWLEAELGAAVREQTPVAGGDICRAFRLSLTDGRVVFAKTRADAPADFFTVEAEGLRALAAAEGLAVPDVLAVGPDVLALEWIAPGEALPRYWEQLGQGLATLHQTTQRPVHGWHRDGYIGRTPQINAQTSDAAAFWRDARLGPQLALARQNGLTTAELDRLGERLLARLPDLLDPALPACLLHGDLWSGNAQPSASGTAFVFDPAVYYGPREAELALCHLFGGFDQRFFDAYEAAWPLGAGAEERRPLFALYHLINHLNLFGGGYRNAVLGVLRRYA